MNLVKYRDPEMKDYVWFYTIDDIVVSPYFNSEDESIVWLEQKIRIPQSDTGEKN